MRLPRWLELAGGILAAALLGVVLAQAALGLFDEDGDRRCASGEWTGPELCPTERSEGRW